MSALRSVLKAACYVAVSAAILPIPGFCQWQPCGTGGPVQCVQGGDVGVGTLSPSYPFHVVGVGPGNYQTLSIQTAGATAAGLHFVAPPGGINWTIASMGSGSGQGGGKLLFYRDDFDGSGASFTIGSSGSVGMGTTDPCNNAASASVPNCKLSVNGGIQAQAVVVNSNWSDYVFAPDYRLAPLSEVADYI